MYRNLALLNGVFLAIMIFLNGILSDRIGPYMSTLIYNILGFLLILLISLMKKNTLPNFNKIPTILLLPGVLSVITILLNNISLSKIGVTLAVGVGLFGQLVTSSFIDNFGLFGMPINRLKKEKMLGFSMITLGIIFITI